MAPHRVRHYPEARARPDRLGRGLSIAGGGVSIKDFPSIKKKKKARISQFGIRRRLREDFTLKIISEIISHFLVPFFEVGSFFFKFF